MHELSLAENIFETVSRSAGNTGGVETVNVTVGPLSGVNADALAFGFASLAPRYGCGGAKLCVRRTAARARCAGCGQEYGCEDFFEVCPSCGSLERDILCGREFTIDSIELKE